MFKRHLLIAFVVNEVGSAILSIALMLFMALPLAWLWNRTVAAISNVGSLSYWRAVGLLLGLAIIRRAMAGITVSVTPRDPNQEEESRSGRLVGEPARRIKPRPDNLR